MVVAAVAVAAAVLPVPSLLFDVKAGEVEEGEVHFAPHLSCTLVYVCCLCAAVAAAATMMVGEAGAAGAGSGACRRTPTTPEHHLAVDDLPMPLHWHVSEVN